MATPEYKLSDDDRYDRYQIITVGELLEGKMPRYPPFRNVTYKPAPEAKPIKKRAGQTHRLSARSETGSEARASVESFDNQEEQ